MDDEELDQKFDLAVEVERLRMEVKDLTRQLKASIKALGEAVGRISTLQIELDLERCKAAHPMPTPRNGPWKYKDKGVDTWWSSSTGDEIQ